MLLFIKVLSFIIYLFIVVPLVFSSLFINLLSLQVHEFRIYLHHSHQAEKQIRQAFRKMCPEDRLLLQLPSPDKINQELLYIVNCMQRVNPSLKIEPPVIELAVMPVN